jgi:ferredoxin-NADP reductase
MAVPKSARLVAAEALGSRARRLEFEMTDPARLGFVGGQFIIIDTGMALASGRLAKRAYSMTSSDADQTRFELVARRMEGGVCSNYLHQLEVGSTLTFSGPWGKFLPDAASSSLTTWVVATDTGITAALGLLRAAAFRERLSRTTLLWLSPSSDDFISEAFVRERVSRAKLERELREVRVLSLPPVHHSERLDAGLAHFNALPWSAIPARAYLAGDGALLYPFARALALAGLAETQVAIESFFNVPPRKVEVSAAGDAK